MYSAPAPPAVVVGAQRRLETLDRVLRPLTLLVAPAGAGKTATLAAWAARAEIAPLWFDGRRPDDRAAVRRLAQDGAPHGLVIVDDAHGLTSVDVDPLVALAVGGDAHVILSSRRDPPIPVARLELSGRLAILRGDHLRLTWAETVDLVSAHAPDAASEDVEAVGRRADGWAAAVVLGARMLASAADRGTARAALIATDQPVLDYLLDEVFATLPAATRHVLLCTADEADVTEAAATVLSGDPDAATLLAQLAVDGMFVARYDRCDPGGPLEPVWVYHPLLLELLRREGAAGMSGASVVAAAHARAARHYAATGRPAPALRHAVASRSPELMVDLLVRLAPRLLATGSRAEVHRALAAIPAPLRTGHRGVLTVAALERRAAGDTREALRIAGDIAGDSTGDSAGDSRPDPAAPAAPGWAALTAADAAGLDLWLSRAGIRDADVAIRLGRALLRDRSSAGHALDPARLAGLGVELAATVLWVGDVPSAAAEARRAAAVSGAVGSARLVAAAETVAAVTELLAARFQTAAAVAQRSLAGLARELAREEGAEAGLGPDEPCLRAVLGLAAWHAMDGPEARRQLDLSKTSSVAGADPLAAWLLRQLAARVLLDEGDLVLARRIVASDAELPPGPVVLSAMLELLRGELALAAGDVAAAAGHIDVLRGYGWESEARLVSAGLAIRSGRPDAVRTLVAPVLRPGSAAGPRAEACAAAASAFALVVAVAVAGGGPGADLGDVDDAGLDVDDAGLRVWLRDLLTRCAPQRLVRIVALAAQNPLVAALLRHEAEAEDGHPFAAEVVEALATAVPAAPAPHLAVPGVRSARRRDAGRRGVPAVRLADHAHVPLVPVPPLTERELDVLALLARGDSYLDIAHRLYITQNTVKTHVASLYRKLNATRRSEALRAAWALGLLAEVVPVEVAPAAPAPGERGA
ncbi:MAG TPA: LuxR C-terminal-related transcriptional regulator [Kineosporiaceae bacterium]|nr:LuxR C-terminal-related transcriptional regulator [Kineosporiaceae bacterium]